MKFESDYIEKLAKIIADNDLTEISLEDGEQAITIRKDLPEVNMVASAPAVAAAPQAAPVAPQAASAPAPAAKEEVKGTKILDIPSIETYGVEFPMVKNTGEKTDSGYEIGNDVTSDEAIRKALNTAVDRQSMVDGVLNGYGTVSTTGLEKMPWLNKDTVLDESEYNNMDEAKKILSNGGWKDSDNDGILYDNGWYSLLFEFARCKFILCFKY